MTIASAHIAVEGDEHAVTDLLRWLPSGGASGAPRVTYRLVTAPHGWDLRREGEHVAGATSVARLRQPFFDDIQQFVTEFTCASLVHAGVVALADGLIVMPGSSHAGKTTLTAALVEAGASYYSDEQAVVDERGRIEAFPRPLLIRDPTALPDYEPDFAVGGPALRPTLIVLTQYEWGATWAPEVLPPSDALMAVVEHSVTIRYRPESTLRALKNMVAEATCLRGPRGDARETAAKIVEFVGG